jgi:hypothetical protein
VNVGVQAFLPGFEEAVMFGPTRFSAASDDEIGGFRARSAPSDAINTVPPMGFEPMLERV